MGVLWDENRPNLKQTHFHFESGPLKVIEFDSSIFLQYWLTGCYTIRFIFKLRRSKVFISLVPHWTNNIWLKVMWKTTRVQTLTYTLHMCAHAYTPAHTHTYTHTKPNKQTQLSLKGQIKLRPVALEMCTSLESTCSELGQIFSASRFHSSGHKFLFVCLCDL